MNAAAIIYVQRLQRMTTFYERCFGFGVTDATADYCVLESQGWTLTLVVIPDVIAAGIHLSVPPVPPVPREGTPIKLAFQVADIEDVRQLAESLGGRVEPATTTWEFQHLVRCDCLDPEGNIVQLLQAPA